MAHVAESPPWAASGGAASAGVGSKSLRHGELAENFGRVQLHEVDNSKH